MQTSVQSSVSRRPRKLSAYKTRILHLLEKIVDQGLHTFIQVGESLGKIQKDKLYKAHHKTFEDYCRERFSLEKSQVYRKISAAIVARKVSPFGEPINEYAIRPLTELPESQYIRIWKKAVADAGGDATKVTHKDVVRVQRETSPGQKLKNSEEHRKRSVKPDSISRKALVHELDTWFDREGNDLLKLTVPTFFARVKKQIKSF